MREFGETRAFVRIVSVPLFGKCATPVAWSVLPALPAQENLFQ